MQAIKLLYVMQENRIIENCSQLHTVILVICRPANIRSTDQNYSIVTDNVSV